MYIFCAFNLIWVVYFKVVFLIYGANYLNIPNRYLSEVFRSKKPKPKAI